MTGETHWARHAPQWELVGTPLRPGAADIAVYEAVLRQREVRDALVLGMTPELLGMGWSAEVRRLAVDRAAAMIRALWRNPATAAVCADWRALPVADGAFDLAVGDGSLNMLEGAAGLRAFVAEMARVLRPGGRLVLRVFTRPDVAEAPAAVLAALHRGRIGSFHAFKWRLAMALHGDVEAGVRLAAIWRCWNQAVPEPAALLDGLGWDPRLAATIDLYRDVATRYSFPTAAETAALLTERFETLARHVRDYELAECCPILVLRRLSH